MKEPGRPKVQREPQGNSAPLPSSESHYEQLRLEQTFATLDCIASSSGWTTFQIGTRTGLALRDCLGVSHPR
jgi:hypothetical protein